MNLVKLKESETEIISNQFKLFVEIKINVTLALNIDFKRRRKYTQTCDTKFKTFIQIFLQHIKREIKHSHIKFRKIIFNHFICYTFHYLKY